MERFLKTDIGVIYNSRDEKQDVMRKEFKTSKIKFYIGDVRDYNSIARTFISLDFVFHIGALKQVPSCEFYPMEAVKPYCRS